MELARTLLALLGKPESLITFVKDRPGHGRRYPMNPAKLAAELGWRPQTDFAGGLARTVEWYLANRLWWQRVKAANTGNSPRAGTVPSEGRLHCRPC